MHYILLHHAAPAELGVSPASRDILPPGSLQKLGGQSQSNGTIPSFRCSIDHVVSGVVLTPTKIHSMTCEMGSISLEQLVVFKGQMQTSS